MSAQQSLSLVASDEPGWPSGMTRRRARGWPSPPGCLPHRWHRVPLIFVETLSARISGVLLSLGTKAPLGYAFVAGMVASVNPCGFVLC